MAKRVQITDKIQAQIKKNVGTDIPFDQIAVFEAIGLTTRPIQKGGSIFDKGVISKATLDEMASMVNNGAYVPKQTLHQQGWELPVGRVFAGQVVTAPDGAAELHLLFYISGAEPDLIQRVEDGSIQEVSQGAVYKKAICSGCDFDYMTADSEAWWDRTCANGHVLGMGDYHLNLEGVAAWLESSLVCRGASPGNNILGTENQVMLQQARTHRIQELAASGQPTLDLRRALFSAPTVLEASADMDKKDVQALIDESLTALKTELSSTTEALKKANEQILELTNAKTTSDEKITALETSNSELKTALEKVASLGEKATALTALADKSETLVALDQKVTGLDQKVATLANHNENQPFRVNLPTPAARPAAPTVAAFSQQDDNSAFKPV